MSTLIFKSIFSYIKNILSFSWYQWKISMKIIIIPLRIEQTYLYFFHFFFLKKSKYFFALKMKWNRKWKIHFFIINSTLYLAIWYLILFFIIIIFLILCILIFEPLWIRKIIFFASKFLSNILTLNSLIQCELNPMKKVNIFSICL